MIAQPAALAPLLQAQTQITVRGEAHCGMCSVRITPYARLGMSEGDGALSGEPSGVTRDRRGRFYITQFAETAPLVFDSRGQFLTTLGRHGAGPGEFTYARALRVSNADSLYVADPAVGRISIFGPDLKFVRAIAAAPLAGAFPLEITTDGGLVAAWHVPTAAGAGFPLHLFDPLGTPLKSVGEVNAGYRADRPILMRRRLARSAAGGFWAAHVTEYVLERFDQAGRKLAELRRDVPWFRSHQGTPISIDPQPKPMIMGIHEDSGGRLIVLSVVPDPQWRQAVGSQLPSRLGGGRGATPVVQDNDRYYDSVLEVIDPATGSVVVSQRFPLAYAFLIDASLVARRVEDSGGNFVVEIAQVAVAQQRPP